MPEPDTNALAALRAERDAARRWSRAWKALAKKMMRDAEARAARLGRPRRTRRPRAPVLE